jgi:ferritin-like metal-binding protein YciE
VACELPPLLSKIYIMPTTTKKKSAKSANASNKTSKSKGGNKATQEQSSNASNQLQEFFHDQLKDMYWAEKHLLKALPKMMKAASSEDLQGAIEEHLAQTEEQVYRLEEVFEIMGEKPQAKKCDGMEGLVKEGETAIEETEDGSATRDAAIIMSAQKVEHYEIAAYGTMVQLAHTMGQTEIAELLETTLEEEKQTDESLTELAESSINWEAATESEEEEEKDA